MVASQIEPIDFAEFLEWYPEESQRYELIEGVIVEMLPTGSHEDISGFLVAELNFEIRRQNLPYSIPKNCLIKPFAPRSGYLPDVAIINREYIKDEILWQQSSVIQQRDSVSRGNLGTSRVQNGKTVPLVIEVVSTNWRDDYGHKFVEYEAMGIQEYWLVDYRALGAVRYIGKPKQPTITICQLVEEEYQIKKFVKGDRLQSSIFPQLELTTDAIYEASQPCLRED